MGITVCVYKNVIYMYKQAEQHMDINSMCINMLYIHLYKQHVYKQVCNPSLEKLMLSSGLHNARARAPT